MEEIQRKPMRETIESLGDLGKLCVEFGYGEIYMREGLAMRDRAIATIAILASCSGVEHELEVHINAGLCAGLTYGEIEEIIIHTTGYSGFPAAINAMKVLLKFKK